MESLQILLGSTGLYNLEDLLEHSTFDLALNLTNLHLHYEVSKTLLEFGKHVYSEKPLAMSFDEAHSLVALAASPGLNVNEYFGTWAQMAGVPEIYRGAFQYGGIYRAKSNANTSGLTPAGIAKNWLESAASDPPRESNTDLR